MKKLLITTSILAFAALPAQAQLLGGGGITGGLGSSLDLSGTLSRTGETIGGATQGTLGGRASTQGEQSVDRRSGAVKANRKANAEGSASASQVADTAILPIGASASGTGNASGEGNAEAQLLGTDALHSASVAMVEKATGAVGTASGLAGATSEKLRNNAAPSLGTAPTAGGSASGSGSAAGNGSAALASMPLTIAGTTAGMANGATNITPGMPVMTSQGAQVGKIREIVANSRGEVEHVVIANGDALYSSPATNLAADSNALIVTEASATSNEPSSMPSTGGDQ